MLLLDGLHLIDEARRAGATIEVAVLSVGLLRRGEPEVTHLVDQLETAGIETLAATAKVLDAMSPVRTPSGAVALARHAPTPIDRLFARPGPVPAAVGVQDPGNLGAIIRAADAADAAGVLVAAGSADPYGWKALRGAMGSTFRIPVSECHELPPALEVARAHQATIVAAVPRGGRSLYDLDLSGPSLILIGGEGAGLEPPVTTLADQVVSIPMRENVDSLNTAIAAALIVYEARRQRLGGATRPAVPS